MSDTGWILGSLARNIDYGCATWLNVDNAKINDGYFSYIPNYSSGNSDGLNIYSFSPGIPAEQKIDGIAFRIERHASRVDRCRDYAIHLMQGTNSKGDNKADTTIYWPTSSTEKDYGGATDLWGTAWTIEQANGIGLAVRTQSVGGSTYYVYVDYMSVKIWYSPISCNHLMMMGM